jgi:hypothetical protein
MAALDVLWAGLGGTAIGDPPAPLNTPQVGIGALVY